MFAIAAIRGDHAAIRTDIAATDGFAALYFSKNRAILSSCKVFFSFLNMIFSSSIRFFVVIKSSDHVHKRFLRIPI